MTSRKDLQWDSNLGISLSRSRHLGVPLAVLIDNPYSLGNAKTRRRGSVGFRLFAHSLLEFHLKEQHLRPEIHWRPHRGEQICFNRIIVLTFEALQIASARRRPATVRCYRTQQKTQTQTEVRDAARREQASRRQFHPNIHHHVTRAQGPHLGRHNHDRTGALQIV